MTRASLGAVIIDFGKACETSKGRSYSLSKDQVDYYKLYHPHIAPDLRDGKCKQSFASDIYSFGRIMKIVNDFSLLKNAEIMKLSENYMQYDGCLRNDSLRLKEFLGILITKT